MYNHYSLILMVNHACNLRCSYCYTGEKFSRPMPDVVARKAIECAVASTHKGGNLQIGFFGGEPLIEKRNISAWMEFARKLCRQSGIHAQFQITTNGTILDQDVTGILTANDMDPSVSFDGTPNIHNSNRPTTGDKESSGRVLRTIQLLQERKKHFRVVTVVGPRYVSRLPEILTYFQDLGIDMVDLSLDLWSFWSEAAVVRLGSAIERSVRVWRRGLPSFGINWFNQKLMEAAQSSQCSQSKCGFGHGEIAVSPAGNLYPCERLIGEDRPNNSMRLATSLREIDDFNHVVFSRSAPADAGTSCAHPCTLTCPCSNYVRTGSTTRPDRLLIFLDKVCEREVRKQISCVESTIYIQGEPYAEITSGVSSRRM